MILTRSEFMDRYNSNALKIALIGMSNIGKSFRSTQLSKQYNFSRFGVDSHIEKELNFKTMQEMARWLGYPYENQYKENSERYLEIEKKYTLNPVFEEQKNKILDTTGSIIYLDPSVHQALRDEYLVVCVDVGGSQLREMEGLFFVEPKSVIWGDSFKMNTNEQPMDAIRRCYPDMLLQRQKMYRSLADVIVPGEVSRMENLSAERFFEIVQLTLPV